MNSQNYFLSIVIPVYNESERLYKLNDLFEQAKTLNLSPEIIIVNDGSTDNTLKLLKKYQKKSILKIISYSQNKGKGHALKKGMLAATGKFVLFTDIDLSTPLTEFKKFIPFLNSYDVVIGSRKTRGSILKKRQPILRECLGKGFTFLSSLILNIPVSDFTCGFKVFNQKASRYVFSKLTINRWGFDSEVLFISHHAKFKIKEVSVIWENNPQTKVKFPQDIINSLFELLKIRINFLVGKYN